GREQLAQLNLRPGEIDGILSRARWLADQGKFPPVQPYNGKHVFGPAAKPSSEATIPAHDAPAEPRTKHHLDAGKGQAEGASAPEHESTPGTDEAEPAPSRPDALPQGNQEHREGVVEVGPQAFERQQPSGLPAALSKKAVHRGREFDLVGLDSSGGYAILRD